MKTGKVRWLFLDHWNKLIGTLNMPCAYSSFRFGTCNTKKWEHLRLMVPLLLQYNHSNIYVDGTRIDRLWNVSGGVLNRYWVSLLILQHQFFYLLLYLLLLKDVIRIGFPRKKSLRYLNKHVSHFVWCFGDFRGSLDWKITCNTKQYQ